MPEEQTTEKAYCKQSVKGDFVSIKFQNVICYIAQYLSDINNYEISYSRKSEF